MWGDAWAGSEGVELAPAASDARVNSDVFLRDKADVQAVEARAAHGLEGLLASDSVHHP
jgi:hypothetical protein